MTTLPAPAARPHPVTPASTGTPPSPAPVDSSDAAPAARPAAVTVTDVHVAYGEVRALTGVDLTVAAGTVCGVIGINGSGKSTLFSTLIGARTPDRGTVRVFGETPDVARRTGRIAFMPQNENLDWSFPISVREVVSTGRYGRLGMTRRLRPADHRAVAEALARVELADLATRRIGALSGGQRKRAFLARAIAQDADLLLLDEPFAGVDAPTERRLVQVLRELAAEGRTIVVTTHGLEALPDLCDEAALLFRRVLLKDSVEIVTRPENLALVFGSDR